MTDDTKTTGYDTTKTTGYDTGSTGYETRSEAGAAGDESFAWREPETQNAKSREWIAQLQSMIENLATQAGPVVKEVGAKAAELAALAGEKAGPVAAKAAELTGQAGQKLAVKGRDFAAELRRDAAGSRAGEAASETAADVADATTDIGYDEPTRTGVA